MQNIKALIPSFVAVALFALLLVILPSPLHAQESKLEPLSSYDHEFIAKNLVRYADGMKIWGDFYGRTSGEKAGWNGRAEGYAVAAAIVANSTKDRAAIVIELQAMATTARSLAFGSPMTDESAAWTSKAIALDMAVYFIQRYTTGTNF